MAAALSAYPRVSEWIYFDTLAVNMAAVASIEFRSGDGDPAAVVRLVSFNAAREAADKGTTWFEVRKPAQIRFLRSYVESMIAVVPQQ